MNFSNIIAGINPNSFNDYPKEVSYVIFLGGCNFRCPYCHNSSIVNKTTESIDTEDVLKDLIKRKKFVKAVVITGGEPTIHGNNLMELIDKIKNLGFKVKLDTNGTNPKLLKKIISLNLVDYIAMDIKNTFDKYDETTASKVNIDAIKESIKLIEESNIEYEFRSTINKTQHNADDVKEMKRYVSNPKKLFLQNYQYSKEQIENKDFGKFSEEDIKELSENLEIEAKV